VIINIDLLCPNKLCLDNVYFNFVQNYLVPSAYDQTLFEEVLSQTPTFSSFIMGKTLFDSLNIITESYRKYKNYSFLSTTDVRSTSNYNWLLDKNKKSFNSNLYNLQDLISKRMSIFVELENSLINISVLRDLENSEIVHVVDEIILKRIDYVRELLNNNVNIFNNLIASYKSNFPLDMIE